MFNEWIASLSDIPLLLGLILLFLGAVTALVDALLEEVDRRAESRQGNDNAVLEGVVLRDQLFLVRHVPGFFAAGITLLGVSLALSLIRG